MYFDDLQFLGASVMPQCTAVLDRCFAGSYSLEFVLSGRMAYGRDHGPQVILDEPAAFWHHPRHSYQYGAVDAEGWYHHWVLMRGKRAQRLVEQGLMPLAPAGYLPVRQARAFAGLFQGLVALVERGEPQRHGDAVVLLERLLCLLMSDAHSAAGAGPHAEGIEAVARAVQEDPCRRVDWQARARSLHLSQSQFRRLFQRCVGHAPHAYLLLCRMRFAARALQDPKRQVKDVAAECGYEDPAQFCKLFKNKLGLSPGQYRASLPLVHG